MRLESQTASSCESHSHGSRQRGAVGDCNRVVFFNPLLGTALGAASGVLAGTLSDYGIDDDFIKSLATERQPSSSTIFMLVRRATVDRVEPELAKFGGKILRTSLSREAEAKFQAMLDEANKVA